MIVESIVGIIGTIFDKVLPDKNRQEKQNFLMEVQKELNKTDLLKGQLEVNKEEAANPNRKWVTWRELIGYACATAIWYMWIIQPVILVVARLSGHTLLPSDLVQINVVDVLTLAMGMLGLSYTPSAVSYVAEKVKTLKKS